LAKGVIPAAASIASITMGAHHAIALTADGAGMCYKIYSQQCFHGERMTNTNVETTRVTVFILLTLLVINKLTPIALMSGKTVQIVEAGGHFSMALTTSILIARVNF
jgi:alpha-tubulin suppressor-like RCC1 family protein